jgi:hypothetical protein
MIAMLLGLALSYFIAVDLVTLGDKSRAWHSLGAIRVAAASIALGGGLCLGSWMLAERKFSLRTLVACVVLLATALALAAPCLREA